MTRLLFWALLLYLGYRIVASLKKSSRIRPVSRRERGPVCTTHRDPVCGTYITEEDAVVDTQHGQRLYFCSHACRDRYREQSERT